MHIFQPAIVYFPCPDENFIIKNYLRICVKSDSVKCGDRNVLFGSTNFVFLTEESFVEGGELTLVFGIPFDYELMSIRYDDANIGITQSLFLSIFLHAFMHFKNNFSY